MLKGYHGFRDYVEYREVAMNLGSMNTNANPDAATDDEIAKNPQARTLLRPDNVNPAKIDPTINKALADKKKTGVSLAGALKAATLSNNTFKTPTR